MYNRLFVSVTAGQARGRPLLAEVVGSSGIRNSCTAQRPVLAVCRFKAEACADIIIGKAIRCLALLDWQRRSFSTATVLLPGLQGSETFSV